MKKLAVTFELITEAGLEKIESVAPEYEVVQLDPKDESIPQCEIVFGWMSLEMIHQSTALKWLHTSFSGVDSLLKPESNFPKDVVLTNSAGTYGIAISEYLITTTLMLMRKNMAYAKLQFQNTWQPLGTMKAIYGSHICVVGLGDIGENYAQRCGALGAKVSGVVRQVRTTKPDAVDQLYTIDQLDEAIQDADVVALCLPSTSETIGLFDEARLNQMKPGAIILNVGRGTAIDTESLIAALESGHIGGAGLDVTEPEPLPADSPLWQMDNVVITPHISANQSEALTSQLIVDKFVRYLQDYVAGRRFERVVDKEAGY